MNAACLGSADRLYSEGQHDGAISLARLAAEHGAVRAWQWVGLAACSIHRTALAGEVYKVVNTQTKQLIARECVKSGHMLGDEQMDGHLPTP